MRHGQKHQVFGFGWAVAVLLGICGCTGGPTVDAGADTPANVGHSVTLHGSVVCAMGPCTLLWEQVDGPPQDLADTEFLEPTVTAALSGTSTFRLTATDTLGRVGTDEVSVEVACDVPIVITQQPVGQNRMVVGGSATFSVAATGPGALTYQWRRNGVAITDGPHYVGANTPTLTVVNVNNEVGGNYDCIISSAGCGVLSSYGILIPQVPPGQ